MKRQWKKKVFVSVLILCLSFTMIIGAGAFAQGNEWNGKGLGGFQLHADREEGHGSDSHDDSAHEEEGATSDAGSGASALPDDSQEDGAIDSDEHGDDHGGSTDNGKGHWGGGTSDRGGDDHGKPDGHEPGEEEEEESPDPFDESIEETVIVDEGKFVTLNIHTEGLEAGDEAIVCVYKLDDGIITYKNLIELQGGALSPYGVQVPVGHECFIESAPVPGYATPQKQQVSLGVFKGNFSVPVTLTYIASNIDAERFVLSFNEEIDSPLTEATLILGEEKLVYPLVSPANAKYNDIAWFSLNEEVAMVESGVVTAVGSGDTTIGAQLKWNDEVLKEASVEVSVQDISSVIGQVLTQFEYQTGQRYPLPMGIDVEIEGLSRTLNVSWPDEWAGGYLQHLDDGDYLYFIDPTEGIETVPVDADVELYGRVYHDVSVSGMNLMILTPSKLNMVAKIVNQGDFFQLSYSLAEINGNIPWDHTDLTGFYFTSTNPNIVGVTNENRILADVEGDQVQAVTNATAKETGYAIVYLRNSQGTELASWGISVVKAENELVDNAYIMASTAFMGESAEEHYAVAEEVYITCKNLFDADQVASFASETYHIRVTEKGSDGLLGKGEFTFSKKVVENSGDWIFYASDPIEEVQFDTDACGYVQVNDQGLVATDGLGKTIAGFHLIDVLDDLKANTNASKEVFVEISTDNDFPDGDEGDRPKTYHTNFKIGSAVPEGDIEVAIMNPQNIPADELVGRHVVLTREEFPPGTTLGSVSIYDFYQEDVNTNPPNFLDDYATLEEIYTQLYVDEVKLFGRIATRASVNIGETELYVKWEAPREIPLKIGGYFLLIDFRPYKTDLESYDASFESMLKEVHLTKSGDVVNKTVTIYP